MEYTFYGKLIFDYCCESTPKGTAVVQTDSEGYLIAGDAPADGSDRFNLYGDDSGVVIQSAANGKYVERSDFKDYEVMMPGQPRLPTYKAVQEDRTKATVFYINPQKDQELDWMESPPCVIQELDSSDTKVMANWNYFQSPNKVVGVPTSEVSYFMYTIVTPRVEVILGKSFNDPGHDFTWVDISGSDLTASTAVNLSFSRATAENANFSNCTFPKNVVFSNAKCANINLSGASLPGARCANVDFTGANLDGAKMKSIQLTDATCDNMSAVGTDMSSDSFVARTSFKKAKMNEWSVKNATGLSGCDFSGASLCNAHITAKMIPPSRGGLDLSGADLTKASLHNADTTSVTVYPNSLTISSETNFTGADIRYLDLTGYDLSGVIFTEAKMNGCKLDKTKLDGADLSYATLDEASFTGTATLHGTNLTHASLAGCDLTGAQLGALSLCFFFTQPPSEAKEEPSSAAESSSKEEPSSDYKKLLKALEEPDPDAVVSIFGEEGVHLTGTVTITKSRYKDQAWTITTTTSSTTYRAEVVKIDTMSTIEVSTPVMPAALSKAFLVNTNFSYANLIGVNASGSAFYGTTKESSSISGAQMRDMNLSNANLSNQIFSSSALEGVIFSSAILSNAQFNTVTIGISSTGSTTDFTEATLVGADFDGAMIADANFSDSVFGISNLKDSQPENIAAGAWRFKIPSDEAVSVISELNDNQSFDRSITITNEQLAALSRDNPPTEDIINEFGKEFGNELIPLISDDKLSVTGYVDYWRLDDGYSQYVIMPGFDLTEERPALAVAEGTKYTIPQQPPAKESESESKEKESTLKEKDPTPISYLPLSLQSQLAISPISKELRQALKKVGISVGVNTTLTKASQPSDWQFVNPQNKHSAELTFWLNPINQTEIVVRKSLYHLAKAFPSTSPISDHSTVEPLKDSINQNKQIGWVLDNNSRDPFNTHKEYVYFNILQDADGSLDVYGGAFRVERLSSEGAYEYKNILAGLTNMTQDQLNGPGNICPNGEKSTTCTKNKLSFDEWLHPSKPPAPPSCIPAIDGTYNCPV
ncbi:pentapeptide repeat-containing protein [Nisaea sp.]|uniref:pentapeptide repeat-containing protein n=1 Tax=Nisaea sp. TaxID=2024842 RepID=UPI00326398D5